MALAATVLVATDDTERRDALVAAAHAGGFESLSGATAEAVLRAAVGNDPDVIVIDARMPGLEGFALHERLSRTGLELPPIIVLVTDGAELPRTAPPRGLFVLSGTDTSTDGVMQAVRLILLAADIDAELAGGMKLLHGDLVRSPFPALVRALQRHRITGSVTVHGAQISGFAVVSGVPIDAWRGPARGLKAFHRLADLQSGAFSLAPGRSTDERTIDVDPDTLVEAVVRERRHLDEIMARLPSLDARVDVSLTPEFFTQVFSPIERSVLGTAHDASTLRELFDAVDAVDGDVARTVVELRERQLLRISEATGRVHVVTDATCDLRLPDARRLGIEVVPSPPADEATEVSPNALLETLLRLVPTGDVLTVVGSSALSETHAAAVATTNQVGDQLTRARRAAGSSTEPRVMVVDSRQLSGPLGMTAVFATRMLAAGIGLEATARRITDLGRRWRTMLLLPTLDAIRDRRGSGVAAGGAGESPDLRWIVSLENGRFRVDDSTEVATARTVLADRLLGSVDRSQPVFVGLFHASAPAEVAALRTMLRARLRVAELWEFQMGSPSVALTGSGTVGASILQPDADELEVLTERG
jgi:fatty acid-binding protein DegV/CheY-like chemotaxis protein